MPSGSERKPEPLIPGWTKLTRKEKRYRLEAFLLISSVIALVFALMLFTVRS